MPMDADDEFETFYDFRRAYTDLNIKRKNRVEAITQEDTFQAAENGFDMEMERKIIEEQKMATQESEKQIKEDQEKEEVSEDDWEDCDVEDDKNLPPLETVGKDGTVSQSEASAIEDATDSASGFSQLSAVINGVGKNKGKTRIEAFKELDIEPVELLPSGELKLPSGKVIGHRDYKHIYRQRLRLPDERE